MEIDSLLKKILTRRAFLKASTVISGSVLGGASFHWPGRGFAYDPDLAGNRVVWVHDKEATYWDGVTGHYRNYVNQDKVNRMIEVGVKTLTGELSSVAAWKKVIPGYTLGKKIAIKVNINNATIGGTHIDALPQPVNGVIAGLKSMGVLESDIYVMEPSRPFPRAIGDPIIASYPGVQIWDVASAHTYGHGVSYNSSDSSLMIRHALYPSLSDSKLPDQLGEASYLINMPILKGHNSAVITLCFKNNYGFFPAGDAIRRFHIYCYPSNSSYSYEKNPLLDIYLNPHIKDKTVLIIGDGLFGHRTSNYGTPEPWNTFGGKFPNSLLFSTDPVAVDSVMWDFSNAESSKASAGQMYLHRAVELGVGVHEHWNNATEKKYATIDFRKIDMNAVPPSIPPSKLRIDQ